MPNKPWDARAAAALFESRTAEDLAKLELSPPEQCFREMRFYLQRMTDKGRTISGTQPLKKYKLSTGETQINAGPTVFRDPCESCVRFRSGAQLSFGVILRLRDGRTKLLAYRFHLELLSTSGLPFVRIELNPSKDDYDPLHMPRSHLHPGYKNVHVPYPVMRPLEVLDRIFYVIEPAFTP